MTLRALWCAAGLCLALTACRPGQAARAANAAGRTEAPSFTVALLAQGDSIFHARACQRCHGPDARGTRNGPNLTDETWLQIDGTYSAVVRIITDGVPMEQIKDSTHTLDMQPRGGLRNPLTDEQIRAVAAYVYTLGRRTKG